MAFFGLINGGPDPNDPYIHWEPILQVVMIFGALRYLWLKRSWTKCSGRQGLASCVGGVQWVAVGQPVKSKKVEVKVRFRFENSCVCKITWKDIFSFYQQTKTFKRIECLRQVSHLA